MWDSKLFKTGIGILLLFLIIYVGSKISFIFQPFVVIFEALFFSFLISGLLYYLTLPVVDWLNKHKLPRPVSILLTYLLAVGLLAIIGFATVPILQKEFTGLLHGIPEKRSQIQQFLISLEDTAFGARLLNLESMNIDTITDSIADSIGKAFNRLAANVATLAGFIANIFTTIVIVPFLLYYMLNQRKEALLPRAISRLAHSDYIEKIDTILGEMNNLLRHYVQGLSIVCLFVGVLSYIGFLIIGVEYAFILSFFIMVTNIVPFLGPFIGAIPAVLVGLLQSPLMMLKVIIVIFVVQQMESLLISPQIMGRKLALSPLAIILVVLVAGRLGGLLGIILAIPIFTMLKIVARHILEQIRPHNKAPER